MKILFGIQGTGNGHVSRCKLLAKSFHEKNIQVDYILSGREPSRYFDMDVFGNYKAFKGMTFATFKGKIDLSKTFSNIDFFRLFKDVVYLDLNEYDLIISDFEPITAWAAKKNKIKSLGISNQSAFYYLHQKKENLIASTIMKYYAPTMLPIGLYWYHFNKLILPPITDIRLKSTKSNQQILIYLPFETISDIKIMCDHFPLQQFVCFHPETKETYEYKNINFYTLSETQFKAELISCNGIIANAGFSLVSEALILGKKLLVKPVKGQFEQIGNAKDLRLLGMADSIDSFDMNKIENWLQKENAEPIFYPNVADAIAEWILGECEMPIEDLKFSLWNKTIFPDFIQEQIEKCKLIYEN